MSVGEITEIGPEGLVEALSKLPYSNDERIADIVANGMEFLKNVFTAPFFPLVSIGQFVHFILSDQMFTDPSALLTSETISKVVEEHFADSKKKVQISEKLTYISNKVQEYAQKMGLGKIDLYFNSDIEDPVLAQAFRGMNHQKIEIGHVIFAHSSEAIDCILAHELMHIKHNDCLKDLGFSCSKSILYVSFLLALPWLYSIPLIMLTNGVASLFFNALSRSYEIEADQGALNFLNTNTGMIKFTYETIWGNLGFKYLSIARLKNINPSLSLKTIESGKSKITPMGNDRDNFTHSPLTERLTMAVAFVPKAQSS